MYQYTYVRTYVRMMCNCSECDFLHTLLARFIAYTLCHQNLEDTITCSSNRVNVLIIIHVRKYVNNLQPPLIYPYTYIHTYVCIQGFCMHECMYVNYVCIRTLSMYAQTRSVIRTYVHMPLLLVTLLIYVHTVISYYCCHVYLHTNNPLHA